MKVQTGLLAAFLMFVGTGASQAAVRIADDRGGRIGAYVDRYRNLRSSGQAVIIDGLCASACTIVPSASFPTTKFVSPHMLPSGSTPPGISAAADGSSRTQKPRKCCTPCIRGRCGAGSPRGAV